jgi:PAS domain-containing protein
VVLDCDLSSEAVWPSELRLSEAMHRCLFEEAADASTIADAATARLLEVNARAEQVTGYTRAELLEMTVADLIAPESLAFFMSGYVADARANLTGDTSMILYKPFTLKSLADSVHSVLSGPTQTAD